MMLVSPFPISPLKSQSAIPFWNPHPRPHLRCHLHLATRRQSAGQKCEKRDDHVLVRNGTYLPRFATPRMMDVRACAVCMYAVCVGGCAHRLVWS